jgi:hypothetical protein
VTKYRLVISAYEQATARDEKGFPTKSLKHKFGSVFTVADDDEAARLIRAGAIVPANLDEADEDDELAALAAAAEAEQAAAKAVADEATAPAATAEAPAPATPGEPVDKPSKNANRSDWLAYALAQPGVDAELVDDATKAELIEQFG